VAIQCGWKVLRSFFGLLHAIHGVIFRVRLGSDVEAEN
jgi:hypothetical protein